MKKGAKRWSGYVVALLGAAGVALQNCMAVMAFIQEMGGVVWAGTKIGVGVIQGVGIALGGMCSGVVNLCMNMVLLEAFFNRLFPESEMEEELSNQEVAGQGAEVIVDGEAAILLGPHKTAKKNAQFTLSKWAKFRKYAGSAIFIVTGILFGLTVFAFGPVGGLAAVSIAAGVFVAVVMMIQEVETWLQSFEKEEEVKRSLLDMFKAWKQSLGRGKVVALVLAIGNVVGLSLLFTVGLTLFFTGVGVAAFPAIIAAFTIAFTIGAFTEFYFYNTYLAKYCENFKNNWQAFCKTKYAGFGMFCCIANAVVNAALCYSGVILIASLLTAASIALPPLGVIIGVAATAAVFVGVTSLILGMEFWRDNNPKFIKYVNRVKLFFNPYALEETATEEPQFSFSTKSIVCELKSGLALMGKLLFGIPQPEHSLIVTANAVNNPSLASTVTPGMPLSASTSTLFANSAACIVHANANADNQKPELPLDQVRYGAPGA